MPSAVARLRAPSPRAGAAILPAAGLLAVATVLLGLVVRSTAGGLGTASPPFVMGLDLQAEPVWTLVSTLVLIGAVAAAPRALTIRSSWTHGAALTVTALGVALAVGCSRTGPAGLSTIFDLGPGGSFEAENEYLPGLGALRFGGRFFLDRFAELVPSLPVNVAGHPPAPLLFLHLTGIDSADGLAALCLAAVAALPLETVLIARSIGLDDATARRAGALALLSPVVLLLGVTSVDAIYAALGATTAALLVCRRPAVRAAGCLALAVAALWSWALLAVAAWAAVVVLARDGVRPALVLAAGCGAAVLALNAALYAAYGYDAIGTLRATEAYYRNSVSTVRPYPFWVLGSPVAFGILLGPPIVAGALTAARRAQPAALGLVTIVGVATLAGFTKAETERIWLPFVPLACVAAAQALPARTDRRVLVLLAAQTAAFSLLFNPVW